MILFMEVQPDLLTEDSDDWVPEKPDLVCPKCGATDDSIVTQMEGAGDDTHEMLACTECGYEW
jgi:DNA-directed RNA polymerase subunit M/transcription elongation factor TFIIS